MRASIEFLALALAWFFQGPQTPAPVAFRSFSYQSQVLGGDRTYRVLLPANYNQSAPLRYPVIYWLHGIQPDPEARAARLISYVTTHEVILVDGGPEETLGQSGLYFPELIEQVDRTFRTIADRGHRGVAGAGSGGFMAVFLAGKHPDFVSSASSLDGPTEASTGPNGFPAEVRLDDLADNYDGVRIRCAQNSADSLAFYHRRLNSLWAYLRPWYENVSFLAGQDLAELDHALDFHMASFAVPLRAPAVFSHTDAWPNFKVWGWDVLSNRRQPGFAVLENVSNNGFRSSVRESAGGAVIPQVNLSIGSPAIYPPGVSLTVTYLHLLDGKVRREQQRVDARGKLNFTLPGDAYEVAVSSGPMLTVSGYTMEGANWATAGQPVNLRVRFWNKGVTPMGASLIRWESTNPGLKFATPEGRLNALGPGESATLPVSFTVNDAARAVARIFAVSGTERLPLEVPLFPAAAPAKDFQIADGRTVTVFRHATQKAQLHFGEGNADGHAAPGENFAILVPDGGALRAAEVFTSDACVEITLRGSDSWSEYDHSGASANFSVPSLRLDCEPGHVVHMLGRILIPNGPNTSMKYFTVEFPVWSRSEVK